MSEVKEKLEAIGMIRAYRVIVCPNANPYITDSLQQALELIAVDLEDYGDAESERVSIQAITIDAESYRNLPEWDGP